jgi:cyclopropane-fatty-acyl-phospholipid synthase
MDATHADARDAVSDGSGPFSLVDRGCRALVRRNLAWFTDGEIQVTDSGGSRTFGAMRDEALRARIEVHNPRTYRAVALGGSIGAAEAYADGWWTADELTAMIRIMARNRDAARRLEGWSTWLAWAGHLASFRLRSNRKSQSRRNISAHYDLGNDFFAAFLDRTMTYSCAVFPESGSSLEDGSRHKLDLICQKLELSPGDALLEIGTGWGSLAIHAASTYGCRVVTTTISQQQFNHATRAVRDAGLEDRVTVLTCDYRDLPTVLGRRFDKVVSVEMIEAVGYDFLDDYFQVCQTMTKPGGAMLLQSIVIADALYDAYRRSVDVIQRYIFPGGFLPSTADLRQRIANRTDFRIAHLDDITDHYPRTLRFWRQQLVQNWSSLRATGYPEELLRMWEYYFCYSEGGFLERTVGDVQLLLSRPRA